jgi:hypothetical protein
MGVLPINDCASRRASLGSCKKITTLANGLECGDFVAAFTAGGAGERATELHACGSTRAAAPRQVKAVTKSPHSKRSAAESRVLWKSGDDRTIGS